MIPPSIFSFSPLAKLASLTLRGGRKAFLYAANMFSIGTSSSFKLHDCRKRLATA
jgi:hypothetical protein